MNKSALTGPVWRGARTFGIALFAIGLFTATVVAGEHNPEQARDLLESIADSMVIALRDPAGRGTTTELQALVENNLVPHIDFQVSSALVLGPHWQRASVAERDAFITEFRSFLTRFYTQALGAYLRARDVPADVIVFDDELRTKGDRQVLVSSRVKQPTGNDIPVVYRLLWVDSWKVIDVSLGGISMVRNYQASFSSTVEKDGIDGLIAQLRTRNDGYGVPL